MPARSGALLPIVLITVGCVAMAFGVTSVLLLQMLGSHQGRNIERTE